MRNKMKENQIITHKSLHAAGLFNNINKEMSLAIHTSAIGKMNFCSVRKSKMSLFSPHNILMETEWTPVTKYHQFPLKIVP